MMSSGRKRTLVAAERRAALLCPHDINLPIGYRLIDKAEDPLPNGKKLAEQDFHMRLNRHVYGRGIFTD